MRAQTEAGVDGRTELLPSFSPAQVFVRVTSIVTVGRPGRNRIQRVQIAADPATTTVAKELAEAVLRLGSITALVAPHEELKESGNPLSDRHNWGACIRGLQLDRDVEAELDGIADAFGGWDFALRRLRESVEADPYSPPSMIASLRRLSRHR